MKLSISLRRLFLNFALILFLCTRPFSTLALDLQNFSAWLKDVDYRLVTELSLETRFSTAQDAPDPGESDYRDFTQLRGSIEAKFFATLPNQWRTHASVMGYYDPIYDLKGRSDFTEETLDEYEDELELRELYLEGALLPNLDLKVGRQILIWGYADFLRTVDILNPLDNRDPGLRDLEDIRLPVAMTRLDYALTDWSFNLTLLHEFETNRTPPFGSEFYPFPFSLPPSDFPSYTLGSPGFGLSISKTFNSGDVSVYYADLYNAAFRFDDIFTNPRRVYDRIRKSGLAAQYQIGNWLLKAETALTEDLGFSLSSDEKSRWDVLVGAEYSGWDNTFITLEFLNQRILDFEDQLGDPPDFAEENTIQAIVNVRHDFQQDTMHANMLLFFSDTLGYFQRFSIEKDIRDDLVLTLGYINFQNGDNVLSEDIGRNDKIFLKLDYSF